jgi:hypothetical protein
MFTLELGDGKTVVSAGIYKSSGVAAIVLATSNIEREAGDLVSRENLEEEVRTPFLEIRTDNPSSLDTIIKACEYAKALLVAKEARDEAEVIVYPKETS